ncbi:MAG: hypothetical protein PHQ60_09370 [Sideroxydans sp.]|nr:hypothetical protein [Sideroxydans sp.]
MNMQTLKRKIQKVLDGKAVDTGIYEILLGRSPVDGRVRGCCRLVGFTTTAYPLRVCGSNAVDYHELIAGTANDARYETERRVA